MEDGAFSWLTLHPDLPAMSEHGKAAECQPDPQPTGFVGPTQACKFVKNPFLFCRRDPRTVIAYPEMNPWIVGARACFNMPAGGRKFDGVLHQVNQHTSRHVWIHPDRRKVLG